MAPSAFLTPSVPGDAFRGRSSRRVSAGGFTLLQLLLSIMIIAILVSVMFPLTGMLRKRAERVKCMNQMRNLGTALGVYTTDNGHWPQIPTGMLADEDKFWKWWLNVLAPKPYEIPADMWICPTVKREAGITRTEDITFGSYGPTLFDAGSSTPWKWKQPWLIETGSHHRKNGGPHMLMSDGSIIEGAAWGAGEGAAK